VKYKFNPDSFYFYVYNRWTNIGTTGWHIDGTYHEKPYSHSIYHIVECPTDGATVFAPLTEILENLSPEKRGWWEQGCQILLGSIYPNYR
jgi:alpha-ketoglutarate-dependent taurine dioxygenase